VGFEKIVTGAPHILERQFCFLNIGMDRERAAQRFALLALGRAWTLFGSRKNP
jgi:hypothetical protein